MRPAGAESEANDSENTAQQAMLDDTAMMTVVTSGSTNSGSLNRVRNWSRLNERAWVAGSTAVRLA